MYQKLNPINLAWLPVLNNIALSDLKQQVSSERYKIHHVNSSLRIYFIHQTEFLIQGTFLEELFKETSMSDTIQLDQLDIYLHP